VRPFPELERVERLAELCPSFARVRVIERVPTEKQDYPIHAFEVGSTDRSAPVLGLFGGVHGLERIGTHVVLAYLESLFAQARWDEDLAKRFETCRIVSIPLINPAGMHHGSRSNPNGVDLMRNAPIEALGKTPSLLGGHRYSTKLPWFRGQLGAPMEVEAAALCKFVQEEMYPAKAAVALDVHSGFGMQDRLWYPYAKTTDDFPRLNEVNRLKGLIDQSYPNHVYTIESQSLSYTTHGDLWDYLFDEHVKRFGLSPDKVFIPWTLEIGSWMWIRKNPIQLFSVLGPFNPVKPHRQRRAMRRPLPLLDFFLRAVKNSAAWMQPG
jgi:hypothetical protein